MEYNSHDELTHFCGIDELLYIVDIKQTKNYSTS